MSRPTHGMIRPDQRERFGGEAGDAAVTTGNWAAGPASTVATSAQTM
jgi:hypothetical protein